MTGAARGDGDGSATVGFAAADPEPDSSTLPPASGATHAAYR